MTDCMFLVEWLEIILRIDIPIWTNVHLYGHSEASCFHQTHGDTHMLIYTWDLHLQYVRTEFRAVKLPPDN